MNKRMYRFWVYWLVTASVIFAIQGVSWMLMGSFDPFGIYDRFLANAILDGDTFTQESKKLFHFALVMLGATNTGFFVLFGLIANRCQSHRDRWPILILSAGLASWFILDCLGSIVLGAVFNVLLVNVPCVLVLGIPLVCLYRLTDSSTNDFQAPDEQSDPRQALERPL